MGICHDTLKGEKRKPFSPPPLIQVSGYYGWNFLIPKHPKYNAPGLYIWAPNQDPQGGFIFGGFTPGPLPASDIEAAASTAGQSDPACVTCSVHHLEACDRRQLEILYLARAHLILRGFFIYIYKIQCQHHLSCLHYSELA